MMIHLFNDLPECCKNCCFCNFYNDFQSSWYFCSIEGGAFDQHNSSIYVDCDTVSCENAVLFSQLRSALTDICYLTYRQVDRLVDLVKRYGI